MYTVYKIINLLSNEYYIGVHKTNNPNDRYMGSGIHIKNQIKKYGRNNFKKEILFTFDNENDAYNKEIDLVEENLNNIKCINMGPGGIGGSKFLGKHHTNETISLIKNDSSNRDWIHNDYETKHPKKEELEKYLNSGWKLGFHKKDCAFGRKAWNKNIKMGSMSLEHKNKIKESMKKYWENKKK